MVYLELKQAGDEMATFKGTNKADNLIGTTGADKLYGYGGNDTYTVNHIGDKVIETTPTSLLGFVINSGNCTGTLFKKSYLQRV